LLFLAHITGCWAQIELKLVVREKMGKKTSERERVREKKKIGAVFVSGKKTSEGGREIERKIGVVLFWGRRREREREGERERK
jgi:hypothetical protein